MKQRVVVAMSGGVDSSVTAYLLKEEGYDVIGVTMDLVEPSLRIEREDAARVVRILGIPHEIIDFKNEFKREVIHPFLEEYLSGRTPNPCVVCNKRIKFGLLLDWAKDLGADLFATGHYARIEKKDRRYHLKKAVDLSKDQSYFLYGLSQRQLGSAMMPLGNYTKTEVRKIAAGLGLPVAKKEDSQEICFIPDNDYRGFIREQVKGRIRPGHIIDREGKILGEHQGIGLYTVGQRRDLGVVIGRPQYVLAIDPKENAVIIGDERDLYSAKLIARDVNWAGTEGPKSAIQVLARIRYLHKEAQAAITPLPNGRIEVRFKEPQRAITPGQSVVFYQNGVVIGGGVIE